MLQWLWWPYDQGLAVPSAKGTAQPEQIISVKRVHLITIGEQCSGEVNGIVWFFYLRMATKKISGMCSYRRGKINNIKKIVVPKSIQ